MITVMYWNYQYFKYLVILFILLGFHLFMLNKYYVSFAYFDWFILFTCMKMLVFNLIVSFFYILFVNYHYY